MIRIALASAVACALAAVSASSAHAYVYWATGTDIGRVIQRVITRSAAGARNTTSATRE